MTRRQGVIQAKTSAQFAAEATDRIIQFVRGLDGDGLAAVELLGELPAEDVRGRPSIRIPNRFPLSDEDREAFYHKAEQIGLLCSIGDNEHGVDRQVWELNHGCYEQVLSVMTQLGSVSSRRAETPAADETAAASDDEIATDAPSSRSDEPPPDLPRLREELSAARTKRAASLAESRELGSQYQATVEAIVETTRSIEEMRERLKGLHEHRVALKHRVKSANASHMAACIEAKRLAKKLSAAERASLDSVATTAAEMLSEEAARTGIPIGQLIGSIRRKLAQR